MDKKTINMQTVEILRKWAIGRNSRERRFLVKVEYVKLSDWNDGRIQFSGEDEYVLIKNKEKVHDANNFEIVKYWSVSKFYGTHLETYSNNDMNFAVFENVEKWCRIYIFNTSMKEILQ